MNARTFLPIPSFIKFIVASNPPVTNETFSINSFETAYTDVTYNSLIIQPTSTPKNGDNFTIIDCNGLSETHNIIIDPNTKKINNSTSNFIIAENYAIVNFYFFNDNWNINYGGTFGYTKNASTLNGLTSDDFTQKSFSTIAISGETLTSIESTVPEDTLTVLSDKNLSILANGKIITINISDILDANTLNGHYAKDFTRNGFTSIKYNGVTYTATKPNDTLDLDGE